MFTNSKGTMDKTAILWSIIAVSEIAAVVLICFIWKSNYALAMKVALAFLALIPVVGTLGALWIHSFPSPQPDALRNKIPYGHDVHDRWRSAFEEKDAKKREKRVRSLIEKGHDDQGF